MSDILAENSEDMSAGTFSDVSLNILSEEEFDGSFKEEAANPSKKCNNFRGNVLKGITSRQRLFLEIKQL